MKIYTRQGDSGSSDLLGGVRMHKSDSRFQALGDIDELNAWLGLVKCVINPAEREFIEQLQKDLGQMMSHTAALGSKVLEQYPFPAGLDAVLETRIDSLSTGEEAFVFALPGTGEVSARVNAARTVARRAERSLCALGWEYPLSSDVLKYINRLSDYLFALMLSEEKGERK